MSLCVACSLLMSECQNIEFDKLFFYFYHVLFIDLVLVLFFFFLFVFFF